MRLRSIAFRRSESGDALLKGGWYGAGMATSRDRKTPLERLEDLLREVGTLLIAFAPLDAAYASAGNAGRTALLFLAAGLVMVIIAVILETRR